MQTIQLTGTAPGWCTASSMDSPTSRWSPRQVGTRLHFICTGMYLWLDRYFFFPFRQDINLPLSKTLHCDSWDNLSQRAEWILANTRQRTLVAAQNPLDFISPPPNLHRKWFKNVSPWNQTDKSAFIPRLKMSFRHFYFAVNKLNHFVSTNTAGSLCFVPWR